MLKGDGRSVAVKVTIEGKEDEETAIEADQLIRVSNSSDDPLAPNQLHSRLLSSGLHPALLLVMFRKRLATIANHSLHDIG